jgi:hypothetical protein
MGRKPNIIPTIKLGVWIPEDLRTKMDLYLLSSVEGRVPKGAYQRFICELLREFFQKLEKTNGA